MAQIPDSKIAAFGRRVARARVSAGLTQEALAQRVGYTRQAIGMIETGRSPSTAPGRAAIAAALGVRIETLLGVRPPKKR